MTVESTTENWGEQPSQKSLKQIFEQIQSDGKIDGKDKAEVAELESRFAKESQVITAETREKFKWLLSQTLQNGFELNFQDISKGSADYEVFQKTAKLAGIDIKFPTFDELQAKIKWLSNSRKVEAVTFTLEGGKFKVSPREKGSWMDGVSEFIIDAQWIKEDTSFIKASVWRVGNNNQIDGGSLNNTLSDVEDTLKNKAKEVLNYLKQNPSMSQEEFDKTVALLESSLKNISIDMWWGKLKESYLKELEWIKGKRAKDSPVTQKEESNQDLTWWEWALNIQEESKMPKSIRFLKADVLWFDYKNPTKADIVKILDKFKEWNFFAKGTKIESKNLVQSIYGVQVALSKMGIDVGVIDGGFWENTKKGVMTFQEKMKIEPKDGIPWSVTISKILEVLKVDTTVVAWKSLESMRRPV